MSTRSHSAASARRLLATPVALACATFALHAGAQTQPAAPASEVKALDQVVVTGIRGAIESSISVKRNADSIVESITAEDLGKLPDVSIAESLARLPGLAGQRVNGTTQGISIRGMGPKYGVTLLNGREMISSGADRSVEFDQFPSELMGGATVYKTPDAALGAQGLSGTVNMLAVRPLAFAGRQGSINVRGESNSNGAQIPGISNKGKRLSFSYVDQFANRTLGLAVGFAHLDSPEQQQHYKNWWWANTANTTAYPPDWCGGDCGIKGLARDAVALQGFEATAYSANQVRNGTMAVLEYRPNPQMHTVLDLYYSDFSRKFVGREFQAEMNPWNGVTYRNPVYGDFQGEKVVVGGAIDDISAKLLSRRNRRDDHIGALGLNHEHKLGDWTLIGDLAYSKGKRNERTGELYAGPVGASGFSSINVSLNGFSQFVPTLDWADPSKVQLKQVDAWGQIGSTRYFDVRDELKSARVAVKRDLEWGPVTHFEGGFNYSERSKDYSQIKEAYDLKNGAKSLPFPQGSLMAPASLGFGSIPAVANFDVQALLDMGLFNARPSDLSDAPNRQWGVREKVTTGFARFNLDFVWGLPVRGNAGLQVVHTQQTGSGIRWQDNTAAPISGSLSYTDVLPSLNLAADLGASSVLRLGLARVLARPAMEDMRAGIRDISRAQTGPGLWSANGGNPKLEPWRADAVDLSLEKYLSKRSYVSAAVFYKNLKSTVYKQNVPYDFSGFPDPCKEPTCKPIVTYMGSVNAPANGNGGWVRGTEFTAALDGAMLTQALDGFGALVNASFTKSSIHQGNDLKNPLDGLSGTVYNLSVYYEKHGFQARVGQRYRSRFLAQERTAIGDTEYTLIEPERLVDLQIGYGFEQGPLKGLSFTFQVNNLTNEPYRTKMSVAANSGKVADLLYPAIYEKYGRQYLLGASYKF